MKPQYNPYYKKIYNLLDAVQIEVTNAVIDILAEKQNQVDKLTAELEQSPQVDPERYAKLEALLERVRQLEAEAAAMRNALEEARDLYECAYYEGVYTHMGYTERREKWNDEAQEILANMQQALSPDAGKALLEKVQRLEAVAEAAKAIGDELGDCQCGNAWCTKARVLKQALNALEGGAE